MRIKSLYLLLIILIISIQKVSSQHLNRTYSITPNYPNHDKIGLYALAIPSIICNQLSLAGCLYVFFGTFRRWKTSKTGKIPMTLRIPFYIAITDLLLYTTNFPNILFTFIFHHPWPDPVCGIIGFISILFACLNMTLSLMISIVIYVRVCLKKYFALGSYDWKLLAIVMISSIALTSSSFSNYGEDTWWCSSSRLHVSYVVLSSTVVIISITIFCYLNVMYRIRNMDGMISAEDNENRKKLAQINYRFGMKAITYISIFMFQWLLAFPNHITRFTEDRSVWTFVLFGVSVNSGGILNGIQYYLNEGNQRRVVPIIPI